MRNFLDARLRGHDANLTALGLPPNNSTLASANVVRHMNNMDKKFVPLNQILKDWFETPMAGLPAEILALVEEEFLPMPWDKLSPTARREVVRKIDYGNDPAKEPERQFWWDFSDKQIELEKQKAQWDSIAAPTAMDLAEKERQLKEINAELVRMENFQKQALTGDLSAAADFGLGMAAAPPQRSNNTCRSVSAAEIRRRFRVLTDADKNAAWWSGMTREAKRNGLDKCRVGEGKTGPGGSTWRPDLVAGWLADRHAKNLDGVASAKVGGMLKHFPGCEDVAENMFPDDVD